MYPVKASTARETWQHFSFFIALLIPIKIAESKFKMRWIEGKRNKWLDLKYHKKG